jgi:hypothetical protein
MRQRGEAKQGRLMVAPNHMACGAWEKGAAPYVDPSFSSPSFLTSTVARLEWPCGRFTVAAYKKFVGNLLRQTMGFSPGLVMSKIAATTTQSVPLRARVPLLSRPAFASRGPRWQHGSVVSVHSAASNSAAAVSPLVTHFTSLHALSMMLICLRGVCARREGRHPAISDALLRLGPTGARGSRERGGARGV